LVSEISRSHSDTLTEILGRQQLRQNEQALLLLDTPGGDLPEHKEVK